MTLKECRLMAHKSQRQVANELGVHISRYHDYEHMIHMPAYSTRGKLCASLGITREELWSALIESAEEHERDLYKIEREIAWEEWAVANGEVEG
jgi:transcriptional regulator with XRE-family HTH domain